MSKTGTLAKIGAVLAAPFPDVELLIPALVANPAPGVKFVLGILQKGGRRISEVQSVLFDKAQWAVSDAKKWLKQQGFRIPTADETANFFRFRQKSPARYKEMRTIEAGQHRNPSGSGNFWVVLLEHDGKQWHVEQRYQFSTSGEASEWVREVLKNNPDFGFVLAERIAGLPNRILRTWNVPRETAKRIVTIAKAETVNPPESMTDSLTGHLALTSDPFFQEQKPEIQAAMMTGMDLAERVKQNPGSGLVRYQGSLWRVLWRGKGEIGIQSIGGREALKVKESKTEPATAQDYQRQAGVYSRYNPKKHKRNPESDAAELSEKFHGRPAEKVTTIIEDVEERTDFTELGDLVELKVATLSGYDVTLKFAQKGNQIVKLCSSPDGKQLYFIRGDQSVPLEQIHMGADKWKRDRMILGVLYELTYRTAKGFDKFKVYDYYHKLGEETKEQPMLEYDTLNDKLSVSGGQYHITARGIEN